MELKTKRIFEEINRIQAGKTRIPQDAIQYFDRNLEYYKKYCETLMQEPEHTGETMYYALFSHFFSQASIYADLVGQRERQCFANYREMTINLINGSAKYSNRIKEGIENDLKDVLYELLDNTEGKLQRYGFIDELYKRERQSLSYLGLNEILPTDGSQLQKNTFDRNSFRYKPIPEQIAINLFWINKYWKIIGDSKLSLWLLDTHKQQGEQSGKITDKEKYLAIKREEVLDYVQQLVEQKGEGMTFEEYIICLYSQRASLPDSTRLKNANDKMSKVSPELRQEFDQIERLYNGHFETEPILGGQLINDSLYNLYMLKEKNNVQTIKDVLTRQLIELLVIDRANVFHKYSTWGIAVDKSMTGDNRKMLIMEIPGTIKPLQVHVPQRLIEDGEGKLPDYKGIFDSPKEGIARAYATNFLFYPTSEQTKIMKQRLKKRKENYKKSHDVTEKPFIQLMEYMTSMATRDVAKLNQLKQAMSEGEEQR